MDLNKYYKMGIIIRRFKVRIERIKTEQESRLGQRFTCFAILENE